jgi:transposase
MSMPKKRAASATVCRVRGLSACGHGTYHEDKPSLFIPAGRGTGQTYVHPAKAAEESTIRLLLGDRQKESLTVYTDGFRAYEPLDGDDAFDRQYVVHSEAEYADGDVHVNTCESHASLARRWFSSHRGVSKGKLTSYLRALQLRKCVRGNPGDEALKTILETAL